MREPRDRQSSFLSIILEQEITGLDTGCLKKKKKQDERTNRQARGLSF
jgi:hypothetical protein